MKVLKNYPFDKIELAEKPIHIWEDSPEWEMAYSTWLDRKNPTSDSAWKEGVFLSLYEKHELKGQMT